MKLSGILKAMAALPLMMIALVTGPEITKATGAEVEVRVAGQPPMALAQWFIADKLGYFKDNGLKVTFTKFFPSGAPQVEAGLRNDWDFALMGGPPAITGGMRWDMLTVGLLAEEAGTHRMYVRGKDSIDLKKPADSLRGKDVLVTLGSTGHMMLEACLRNWGLATDDVRIVPLQPAAIVAAFTRGEGVLAQAYPPASFQLEKAGFINICETSKLGVSVYPVLAAHPDFVAAQPDASARFVEAIYRANELFRDDPEKVIPLLFEFFDQAGVKETEENVRLQLKQFEWLSLHEVNTLMANGEAKKALNHMGEFFVRTGLLQEAPEIDFIASSVVADAVEYRKTQGR